MRTGTKLGRDFTLDSPERQGSTRSFWRSAHRRRRRWAWPTRRDARRHRRRRFPRPDADATSRRQYTAPSSSSAAATRPSTRPARRLRIGAKKVIILYRRTHKRDAGPPDGDRGGSRGRRRDDLPLRPGLDRREGRQAQGAALHPHGAGRAGRERPEQPEARRRLRVRHPLRFRHLGHRPGHRPGDDRRRQRPQDNARKGDSHRQGRLSQPRSPAFSPAATLRRGRRSPSTPSPTAGQRPSPSTSTSRRARQGTGQGPSSPGRRPSARYPRASSPR